MVLFLCTAMAKACSGCIPPLFIRCHKCIILPANDAGTFIINQTIVVEYARTGQTFNCNFTFPRGWQYTTKFSYILLNIFSYSNVNLYARFGMIFTCNTGYILCSIKKTLFGSLKHILSENTLRNFPTRRVVYALINHLSDSFRYQIVHKTNNPIIAALL